MRYALIALIIASSGCTWMSEGIDGGTIAGIGRRSYTPPRTKFHPRSVEVMAGLEPEDLYVAALHVFARRGYEIHTRMPEAGLVTTGWQQINPLARARYAQFHAWRVVVAADELTLSIDCRSATGVACGSDRDAAFASHASWIEREIVALARAIAEKRATAQAEP